MPPPCQALRRRSAARSMDVRHRGAPHVRDADRPPQPSPHRPLRGRAHVPRPGARSSPESEVRPLVAKMDKEAQIPRALIDDCFELGIMGIEIPETSTAGPAPPSSCPILAVEELARVDASVAVLVDVQNTLVNNALLRWGSEEQKARYFPKLASKLGGRLRALGGGLGLRRLRARLPRRRQGRPLRADRAQALDHERGRGRAVHRDGQPRPRQGLQGHHQLPGGALASPASRSARRRTSSASAPRPPAS